jgi:uncharacterized sulfatase
VLAQLRDVNRAHLLTTRDLGFLPEGEVFSRSAGTTPYDMGHDARVYPLEKILATAELASGLEADAAPALVKSFEDPDSGVRFWAAQGLLMRGAAGVTAGHGSLVSALADPSPYVRIVAAEALALHSPDDEKLALMVLQNHANAAQQGFFVALTALNSVAQLGDRADQIRAPLRGKPHGSGPHARYDSYVDRLLQVED